MKKLLYLIILTILPFLGFGQVGYRKSDTTLVVTEGGQIQKWKTWQHTSNALDKKLNKKDNPSLLKFNYIGGANTTTPLLSANPTGFDQKIREIGNVLVDDDGSYIFVYSGHTNPYAEVNVYIGIATSNDFTNWTKRGALNDGQLLRTQSEDPYLIKKDGIYYLYVEKKDIETPGYHNGIQLFTANNKSDLLNGNLTDRGIVLQRESSTGGIHAGWESQDVSSPTVFVEDNIFHLIYEGRGSANTGGFRQSGAIGIATSTDGINWTKSLNNPVITGSSIPTGDYVKWATHIVPNDVFKLDGNYYVSIHGYNGRAFVGGILIGPTLEKFKDYLGSWLLKEDGEETAGNGIQYFLDGANFKALYTSLDGTQLRYGNLVTQTDGFFGSKKITTLSTVNADSVIAKNVNTSIINTSENSLRVIPRAVFGPRTIHENSNLEVNSTTGTSTINPTTLSIRTNNNASDWDSNTNWGNLDFYSDDVSGVGASVPRARIGTRMTSATGGTSKVHFSVANTTELKDVFYIDGGTATPFGRINLTGLTASLPLKTDLNKFLISEAINLSSTEVNGTLPVAKGGTGLATLTPGSYINALNPTTLQLRTPTQVRSDIGAGTVTSITPGYGFTSNAPITNSGTLTIDSAKFRTVGSSYEKYEIEELLSLHPTKEEVDSLVKMSPLQLGSGLWMDGKTLKLGQQFVRENEPGYIKGPVDGDEFFHLSSKGGGFGVGYSIRNQRGVHIWSGDGFANGGANILFQGSDVQIMASSGNFTSPWGGQDAIYDNHLTTLQQVKEMSENNIITIAAPYTMPITKLQNMTIISNGNHSVQLPDPATVTLGLKVIIRGKSAADNPQVGCTLANKVELSTFGTFHPSGYVSLGAGNTTTFQSDGINWLRIK